MTDEQCSGQESCSAYAHGHATENARLYAREFAAEQLRKAAKWCEANGYDDAAVDHLTRRAVQLWPA